jgi:alkanesulfonate monooxygenase SsuD/methylene tetrahydromethanopterin reductase-like flavin-dependent oxidoreductase (luciferase family)
MGLGAGGDAEIDGMLGLPVDPAAERIDALDEACQVLEALWTEPTASFAGRHYQLHDAYSDPKPVQKPHPPLWLGSSGERLGLRVVAKHADAWFSAALPFSGPEEPARLSAILDEHCEAVGRDPATIRRAAQFPLGAERDETVRAAQAYIEAGFTDLVLMLLSPDDEVLAEAESALATLPALRSLA